MTSSAWNLGGRKIAAPLHPLPTAVQDDAVRTLDVPRGRVGEAGLVAIPRVAVDEEQVRCAALHVDGGAGIEVSANRQRGENRVVHAVLDDEAIGIDHGGISRIRMALHANRCKVTTRAVL